MKGSLVPKHFDLKLEPSEGHTLKNILEDTIDLSRKQVEAGKDDFVLSDYEEELLEELVAILGGRDTVGRT